MESPTPAGPLLTTFNGRFLLSSRDSFPAAFDITQLFGDPRRLFLASYKSGTVMANHTPIPPVITNAISVPMPLSAKRQHRLGNHRSFWRRQHRTNRSTDIKQAPQYRVSSGNHSALALILAGIADVLRLAHQTTQKCQTYPAAGQRVRHAGSATTTSKDKEADFSPMNIHQQSR